MRGFYPECEQHVAQVAPASRILGRLARFEAAKDRARTKCEADCGFDHRRQRWKKREELTTSH